MEEKLKVIPQQYPTDIAKRDDVLNRFTYHSMKGNQGDRYEALRNAAKLLAELYLEQCPQSRELSLALTKLQEASMYAVASIAINEKLGDE